MATWYVLTWAKTSPTTAPEILLATSWALCWFSLEEERVMQQSSINFTRFNISKRSNRSAKEIIIIGIGEVTQFGSILSHHDKQAIQHTSKRKTSEKETNKKRGRIKRQGWSGGEENERQMENNVMRGRWVCDGYLVFLDLSEDLPGNGATNPSCYVLSLRWFSLKRKGWCSRVA